MAASAMSALRPGIQRVATWAAALGFLRIHWSASATEARNFSIVGPLRSIHGRSATLKPT